MDNIRSVIKILFRYTSPQEIFSGNMEYNNIQLGSFVALANSYMPYYSNNEINNMYSFFKTEFEWHNSKMRGCEISGDLREINVFDAIILFADHVLVLDNGIPLCRYEHLLRWREMIVSLDEDLFVTAFLAHKDSYSLCSRKNFFWPPVIGHNNKELNRLLSQGVAENHFHLKGSSPTFHLSWLSLMNDVRNPAFHKAFQSYERRRLSRKVVYHIEYMESSLYISYLQAALIRLYLFACLLDDYFTLRRNYVSVDELMPYICLEEVPQKMWTELERKCAVVDLDRWMPYLPDDLYLQMKKNMMYQDVKALLEDKDELLFYLPDLQRNIVDMRERYARGQLDYMIAQSFLINSPDRLNEVISGERWFLYEIFKRIYGGDHEFSVTNINWFYAYLLIKETIRAEIIQANYNVGFDNFLLYQNRKELFIEDTPFEKIYLRMAVRDTIKNQHIKKLEARIAPKKSSTDLKKSILKSDACVLELEESEEQRRRLRERFFYVCHFIKEQDEGLKNPEYYGQEFRHYSKRIEVKKQAYAISHFRKRYSNIAQRLKGIDAASEEIGCRPEVFAQAFRFLRDENTVGCIEDYRLQDLCVTYHVGEDFLDIADGLRAIDEAISFLNLQCGDRLGHALALGIDVEDWYAFKSCRILISQMDYLDNLVWLYAKIRKYRIKDCEDAVRYIEKRYDEYFRIVYLNNMNDNYLESVIQDALKYYEEREIQNNYGFNQCYFSINTYYDSWKLRGDDPECYRSGFFKLNECILEEWDQYGVNKMFPENYRIRYNPEAAYLYHTYHYNLSVKLEGDKKKEIKINRSIMKAVKKVQEKMKWEIAQRGLCIETNPSSNALIGTFKRYDKHPILNWYNKGLASNEKEMQSVPQIQVSINTDDQGLFATYIENEYAYLALALEKMRDEEGNPRFSRTLIYQWLDNVRKMGLVQSFGYSEVEG